LPLHLLYRVYLEGGVIADDALLSTMALFAFARFFFSRIGEIIFF